MVYAPPTVGLPFAPLTIAGLLTGRWLARDGSRAAFAKHALIAQAKSDVGVKRSDLVPRQGK